MTSCENRRTADKLFYNGNIYTMESAAPKVEAAALCGDKILYAGEREAAFALASPDCERIDLGGKMMLPGFIDAHAHPILSAFWLSGLNISIDFQKEEVLSCIKRYIDENPDKEAYFGIGYAEWLFDSKGPRKEELDKICDDKPILILGSGGHEGWCNSVTLAKAGITKDTPDPIPTLQYYERDDEGNPTGHIVEGEPLVTLCTSVNFFDGDIIKKSLKTIFDNYSAMGVTAVVDCGFFDYVEPAGLPIMEELERKGLLPQRIFGSCMIESLPKIKGGLEKLAGLNRKYDSDDFRIRTYKILNDGTMESRSASLFEPYDEDGSMVYPMLSGDALYGLCVEVARRGFDIHIHAIGDRSIHETLMAAKAVREAGYQDTRITNAHTEHPTIQDSALFARYDVIANTTGVWHYGNPSMNAILGARADEEFMMRSIIEAGGRMSLGSDLPVDEHGPEPLKSIQMAVTRKMYGDPDAPVLKPESEKLTVQQCLEGYTVNAAYQVHMEDKLGSIKAGKYADLVVLEKDIFDIDPEEIYRVPVEMTLKGGRFTYRK